MNLTGGRANDPSSSEKDGQCVSKDKGEGNEVDLVAQLDQELEEAKRLVKEASEADQMLSSHVWICTSTHAISKVSQRRRP